MSNLIEICVNQLGNVCPHCTRDFDKSHHPNNYDCSRFVSIWVSIFEVENKLKKSENQKEIDDSKRNRINFS